LLVKFFGDFVWLKSVFVGLDVKKRKQKVETPSTESDFVWRKKVFREGKK